MRTIKPGEGDGAAFIHRVGHLQGESGEISYILNGIKDDLINQGKA